MASERRLEKINILLKEELAKIIERESEFGEDTLTTVTRVEASPNLRHAAVFITAYNVNPQKMLENLRKKVYNIQQQVNKRLRIRPVPKIAFFLDEEEMRREGVEKSLAELKRRGEV